MSIGIRTEHATDHAAIAALHQQASEGDAEAKLVYSLRQGGYLVISLLALGKEKTMGHIALSRLSIVTEAGKLNSLSLAPLAVKKEYQRQGIGSALIRAALAEARQQGEQSVFVLGHPEYYRQFGFSWELAQSLASPFGGGDAWMALELVTGALAGVAGRVEFAPPFEALA